MFIKHIFLKSFFAIVILYSSLEGTSFLINDLPLPHPPSTHACVSTPYLSESRGYEVYTNNYGFRNAPNFNFPLKKERSRVLLIGDSVMFGAPNSSSTDFYLSKLLPETEIFNLSSPGANIQIYKKYLKSYYEKLKPDYVVIGLFLGNDFAGPMVEQRQSLRFQLRQVIKKLFPHTIDFYKNYSMRKGSSGIKDNSKCNFGIPEPISIDKLKQDTLERVQLLAKSLSLKTNNYMKTALDYDYRSAIAQYPGLLRTSPSADILSYAVIYKRYLADSLMLKSDNDIKNYKTALAAIDSIIKFAEEKQMKLAFVLFPVSFAIDEKYVTFYERLGYENIEKVVQNYAVYSRLKQDLLLRKAEAIDLHLVQNIKDAFFLEDWHMNDIGSRITAEEIVKFVSAQK